VVLDRIVALNQPNSVFRIRGVEREGPLEFR
jgi:hypothetical protein